MGELGGCGFYVLLMFGMHAFEVLAPAWNLWLSRGCRPDLGGRIGFKRFGGFEVLAASTALGRPGSVPFPLVT